MNSIAVIAPDTDAGKTVVTAALLNCSKKIIGKSIVMKPVQTGATVIDGKRYSPDISEIEKLCNIEIPRNLYQWVVPYNFYAPCSPHLAARKEIEQINFSTIKRSLEQLTMQHRMTIIETAGGVLSPLTDTTTNVDLIKELGVPTVMVAPNRLGAISTTLSAIEAVQSRGITVKGIVFIDPAVIKNDLDQEILKDNMTTIAQFSGVTNHCSIPRVESLYDDFEVIEIALESFAKELFSE